MKVEKFTFLSSDNKTEIYSIKCIPENGKYTKILQIVHGMHEYIEKYIPFMEYLATYGYLVVGHDQLGHGESVTSQKEWGYFGNEPSKLLVNDIHKLRKIIQDQNENIPYFIMGHSMGSFLVRKYLSLYSENLSGAIIMGTGYTRTSISSLGIALAKIIGYFRGGHYFSKFINSLTSGGEAYKKYDTTGKDVENNWISKDPEVVKLHYSEPRVTFPFSVNGYLGIFEAVNSSCDFATNQKIKKDLSILLVSGKDDPVGDNGNGVKAVYNLMKAAKLNDVTLKLFENDRHEILNELDKEIVFDYIKNWMEEKISN